MAFGIGRRQPRAISSTKRVRETRTEGTDQFSSSSQPTKDLLLNNISALASGALLMTTTMDFGLDCPSFSFTS